MLDFGAMGARGSKQGIRLETQSRGPGGALAYHDEFAVIPDIGGDEAGTLVRRQNPAQRLGKGAHLLSARDNPA